MRASVSAAGSVAVEVTVSDGYVANVVGAAAVSVVSLAEVTAADLLGVKLVYVARAEVQLDAGTVAVSKVDSDSAASSGGGFRGSSSDSGSSEDKGKELFHGIEDGVWCWWYGYLVCIAWEFFPLHMMFGEIDATPDDSIQWEDNFFSRLCRAKLQARSSSRPLLRFTG